MTAACSELISPLFFSRNKNVRLTLNSLNIPETIPCKNRARIPLNYYTFLYIRVRKGEKNEY